MTTDRIPFVPWELAPGGDRVSRWPQLLSAYSWDIEHICTDYGDVLKLITGLSEYEKQLIKHNLSPSARAKLEAMRSIWNKPIVIPPAPPSLARAAERVGAVRGKAAAPPQHPGSSVDRINPRPPRSKGKGSGPGSAPGQRRRGQREHLRLV